MVLEEDKYRAELFKIGGFALMSPFGKFVLGVIILVKGYEVVEERKELRWR